MQYGFPEDATAKTGRDLTEKHKKAIKKHTVARKTGCRQPISGRYMSVQYNGFPDMQHILRACKHFCINELPLN
jgi:hypothetical protein